MRLALLMLAACGPSESLRGSNTALICDGMIQCDSYTSFDTSNWRVTDDDRGACFRCLENYPDEEFQGLEIEGQINTCAEMRAIAAKIKTCIIERFYGAR
jgi:hypothetical protein